MEVVHSKTRINNVRSFTIGGVSIDIIIWFSFAQHYPIGFCLHSTGTCFANIPSFFVHVVPLVNASLITVRPLPSAFLRWWPKESRQREQLVCFRFLEATVSQYSSENTDALNWRRTEVRHYLHGY